MAFGGRHIAIQQRQGDIVQRRAPLQQVETLEHEAEAAPAQPRAYPAYAAQQPWIDAAVAQRAALVAAIAFVLFKDDLLQGVYARLPCCSSLSSHDRIVRALLLAIVLGLSVGDAGLLMVLSASASYIVVPAVLRYAIPEANPSLYFGLSLGVTFPLNILLGIPFYTQVAQHVLG